MLPASFILAVRSMMIDFWCWTLARGPGVNQLLKEQHLSVDGVIRHVKYVMTAGI